MYLLFLNGCLATSFSYLNIDFIYLIIMRKVNNQAKRKIFYLLDFIFTLQTEILPLFKHIP